MVGLAERVAVLEVMVLRQNAAPRAEALPEGISEAWREPLVRRLAMEMARNLAGLELVRRTEAWASEVAAKTPGLVRYLEPGELWQPKEGEVLCSDCRGLFSGLAAYEVHRPCPAEGSL